MEKQLFAFFNSSSFIPWFKVVRPSWLISIIQDRASLEIKISVRKNLGVWRVWTAVLKQRILWSECSSTDLAVPGNFWYFSDKKKSDFISVVLNCLYIHLPCITIFIEQWSLLKASVNRQFQWMRQCKFCNLIVMVQFHNMFMLY